MTFVADGAAGAGAAPAICLMGCEGLFADIVTASAIRSFASEFFAGPPTGTPFTADVADGGCGVLFVTITLLSQLAGSQPVAISLGQRRHNFCRQFFPGLVGSLTFGDVRGWRRRGSCLGNRGRRVWPSLVVKSYRRAYHHNTRRECTPPQYRPGEPRCSQFRRSGRRLLRLPVSPAISRCGNRRIAPDVAAPGHARAPFNDFSANAVSRSGSGWTPALAVACNRCCTIFGSCSMFLSPLKGLCLCARLPPGLRPGLHSYAALRRATRFAPQSFSPAASRLASSAGFIPKTRV